MSNMLYTGFGLDLQQFQRGQAIKHSAGQLSDLITIQNPVNKQQQSHKLQQNKFKKIWLLFHPWDMLHCAACTYVFHRLYLNLNKSEHTLVQTHMVYAYILTHRPAGLPLWLFARFDILY